MHPDRRATDTGSSPDDEDAVTKMLRRTGCLQVNTELQECMFEHRDWRKCQELVQSLKECMERANNRLRDS